MTALVVTSHGTRSNENLLDELEVAKLGLSLWERVSLAFIGVDFIFVTGFKAHKWQSFASRVSLRRESERV